ncbi:MAG TPA: hypothetical protein VNN80_03935, partial [Polyangiaceae bacterium]|nr:hypothetical protein [Polyangiaceae bacterium]
PDDLDFGIELARAQVRASQSKDAEASIEALRKLPAPLGEDPRIDVVEAYLAVLLGDPPRAARSSRRAIDKAERLGMRTLAAEAFIMEGHGLFHQGRAAEARTALLEARSRFAFVHDRGGEGNALLELGQQESQQTTQGPELAREHLQQALEIFNLTGHLQGSALAHLGLGNAWGTTGRLKEAEAEFRLALQRFEAGAAQKGGIAAAHANLAIVQSTRGELAAAGESLSTALELVRKLGNRRLEGNALGTRAELGVLTGRLEQARADAAAATQIHQDLHDPGATAAFQVSSAQISRLLGEPAAARTLLEGALPALRAADQPDLLEMGLLTQLQLLLDAGQPERVLAERGAWTERFGLPYRLGSQASAHSRFALALLALGRLAEAREEAAAARRVVETSEEAAPRAESLFAQARVLSAAGEAQAARALLESASEIAQRAGRPSEYELELALAELEKARRAPAWRPTLENIARRAGAENFVFYANRARALLASD